MDGFKNGMILPSLIKQLRSILERYPDDGQILKEMIQNAEDAGASKVIFLIDNSTYGKDPSKLHHSGLADYQGPALFTYNDAVFSDDDWMGIRMLHDSVKADDPMKVGRFGLGFKSVFHLTDLPSVFSGQGIGFIDPHREFFEVQPPGCRSKEKTTSFLWHLEKDREEIAGLEHQFDPFLQSLFNVSRSTLESGNFKGTIFRFPFRASHMKSSDLSKTLYDRDKVKELVKSLKIDSHHLLLFLRNLQSIEVYEKNSNVETKKLLEIKVVSSFQDLVRYHSQNFQKQINVDWKKKPSVTTTYPIAVNVTDHTNNIPVEQTSMWLISHYYAGVEESQYFAHSEDTGCIPLVGVALPFEMSVKEPLWKAKPKGHVFCFLPLPLEKDSPTGLQFHVHGSFAVDQNRRHIKWPSADLDRSCLRDIALVWNQFLVNCVLPKAIFRMITYLSEKHSMKGKHDMPGDLVNSLQAAIQTNPEFFANLVYAMVPDYTTVTAQWKGLADSFFQNIWKTNLFFTPVSSGRWLNYTDAVFDCMDIQDMKKLLLRSVLLTDKKNLVCIPGYIFSRLPSDAKKIGANMVCESLKKVQYNLPLTEEDRKLLLNYLLSGIDDYQKLIGLMLLPLADGSWTEFCPNKSTDKVYLELGDHQQSLLPGLEKKFLNTKVSPDKLKTLAMTKAFQLKALDQQDIKQWIRSIFSKWQSQSNIQLGKATWLTREWLTHLWIYLQKYFSENLDDFQGLHILPLGNGVIVKLDQSQPIVSKINGYNKGGPPLPTELINLCRQVGVQVVDNLEPEVFRHPGVWNKYVLQPSALGVLTALRRQETQIGIAQFAKNFDGVSTKAKQQFREFLANWIPSGELTMGDLTLLRKLPLFSTVDGSGKQNTSFVSLAQVTLAAPTENDIPLRSPKILLNLSEKASRQIAGALGVRPPIIPDLLVDVYFPSVMSHYYDKDEVSRLMLYVCSKLKKLQELSSRIIPSASALSFISKKDGTLVQPCQVYDKTELLTKLFAEEDVFPCGEFGKHAYNEALLSLGMKRSHDVTAQEVLEITKKLSGCSHLGQTETKQSEALMQLLNERGDDLLSQTLNENWSYYSLKDKLSQLQWVKTLSSRPQNYPDSLAIIGENLSYMLAKPSELSAQKHVYLIGSVHAVVETQGISRLASSFSWINEPEPKHVAQHLLNVVISYNPTQKVAVQYVLQKIYRYLDENGDRVAAALEVIGNHSWVWHGNGFARAEQMVLGENRGIDMKPFVYNLPIEIACYRRLWEICEIKKECNFVKVLQAIKNAHEDADQTLIDDELNLQLAVNILNKIAESPQINRFREEIMIPINTNNGLLEMRGIEECTYCDKEWYAHGFSVEDLDDDVFLIHELVPLATAEKLNIPSLINKTIGAEELAIGYGQSEPLTRRLKTILRDYTDGLAVMKELIQNADDAGANEVRFLYDERKNEDCQTILFDKGMKAVQGQALWAYNDAVFTDEDFESIVKLSGATKESATEKIGHFGLGFNAVYNLTDVPMFISREFFAVFDPHTNFLGRAIPDKRKPGIRLNLKQNRKKIQKLTDQFKPMNGIFGCDLSIESKMESYKGTLFRFPLRTREQAGRSEISPVYYDQATMMTLLELLHQAGHQLLLFTQNIKAITVYHLKENASVDGIEEWFSIKKDLVRSVRSTGCLQKNLSPIDIQCGVLKQATAILSKYRMSPTKETPKLESSSMIRLTTTYESKVLLKFKTSTLSDVSNWLVVSCLGQKASFQKALKDTTLVPVGGVAAKLHLRDDSLYEAAIVDSGLLFCFLPLPIETNFPVHVNGFFAVHSSRTSLYETSPLDKIDNRATWNVALLQDAITSAYCILLEDLKKLCPDHDSYIIWPSHSSLSEIGFLGCLTESLYSHLSSYSQPDSLAVVKTINGWTTLSKSRMLNWQFRKLETVGDVALSVLRTVLKDSSESVVDIPERIIQTILQCSICDVIKSKIVSKKDFYTNWFLPEIKLIADSSSRDELILHALMDDSMSPCLKDIECIPVTPNGSELRSIDDLIHPSSEFKGLFDDEEGRFPFWNSGVSISDKLYDRLVSLGMKKDDLPWPEIMDRCGVISSSPSTATERTYIILLLIEKKLKMKEKIPSEEKVFGKIRKIKFLPVMKKPKNFPLKWKGDDYSTKQLISCEEGFLHGSMNLVCCSCPVIDEKLSFGYSCFQTKKKLALDCKTVEPKLVVQQVLEIVKLSEKAADTSPLDYALISEIYDNCFKYLDDYLKKQEDGHFIKKMLASCRSIMLQSDKRVNYFLEPSQCAMKFPLGNDALLPHIAAVPPAMVRSYPVLLRKIGVKETFSVKDYVRILHNIREQSQNGVLDKRNLDIAIYLITQCIYEEVKSATVGENAELLNEMPMPSANSKMCLVKDLCFNNCLWLADAQERSRFCHERIAHEIASSLGLSTFRQDILKGHRLGIPFGQKERLVKRIKRILDSYPFNEDVMKEMLQNADDSGATEIHFIHDTRQLPNEMVFDDSWKVLQGPALCIYNNCSFKKSDLEGIQKLGEGGKADDPTKTGQYGVGFNCVYHLTDVPTFLTTIEGLGPVLCAFDPNCKFVPHASSADPGSMFKNIDSLKKQFSDVFKGYLLEHKQYDVSQSGTLFRLPLRNAEMAKESEISQTQVTSAKIREMFEKFKNDMSEALLFVNSIEKMSLAEVVKGSDGLETVRVIYNVSVEMTREGKQKREEFHQHVINSIAEHFQRKPCARISMKDFDMREVSYEMKLKDSDNNEDVWQVVQRFGFEDSTVLPQVLVHAIENKVLGLMPLGGVAHLIRTSRKVERKNRLFCFLPLPVPTELPVHLNGHFALDHESRRDLWKDENNSVKMEWNRCLMERVIAPAYSTLLCVTRDRIKQMELYDEVKHEIEKYFKIFPKVDRTDRSYVNSMAKAVYACIVTKSLEVFPLQTKSKKVQDLQWKSPNGESSHKIYFDSLEAQLPEIKYPAEYFRSSGLICQETSNPVKETKCSIVRKVLTLCGFSLFSCPVRISHYFEKAGIQVLFVSPDAVLDFFGTHTHHTTRCKVGNVPEKISNTKYKDISSLVALLEYCSKAPTYKERLEGLPFLVTIDEFVRLFDSHLTRYVSIFHEIVPHVPDRFMLLQIHEALKLHAATDSMLCKEFMVEEFSLMLPDLITMPEFYDSEGCIPVESLDTFLHSYKTGTPHWLVMVWLFLQSFLLGKSPEQDKDVIPQLLKPLSNCCILPVLIQNKEMLYPLCRSSGVIVSSCGDTTNKEVVTILLKLGVAEPNYKYMRSTPVSQEMIRLTNFILGSVNRPESVIAALKILTKDKSLDGKLTNSEGYRLLCYLSSTFSAWQSVLGSIEAIKKLPFFITIYNKQTDLDQKKVYILPSDIPSDGMENWTAAKNLTFLKNDHNVKTLLESLGCKELTVEKTYCSFIFESFESLSPNEQIVHMNFVKSHVLFLKRSSQKETADEHARFLERIRNLAFITEDGGAVRSAPSKYYDPANEVFKTMLDKDKFPPQPYDKHDWLSFLRQCGLVRDVTTELFISFARKVEEIAIGGVNDTASQKSQVLIKHLFSSQELAKSQEFLDTLKAIKFVDSGVVDDSLRSIHDQFGMGNVDTILRLNAFKNCVIWEHHELVWTTQNLLPSGISSSISPRHRENTSSNLLTSLGVTIEPQSEIVALHIEKICSTFREMSNDERSLRASTFMKVLKHAFEFFGGKLPLKEPEKTILAKTPCVFIMETFTLITPTQVAIDISSKEEIKPYLYKIPLDFGSYASLFKLLGSTQKFTARQYAFVLEEIANQSQRQNNRRGKLLPSEKLASCQAVEGLLSLVKEGQPVPVDICLYLPCTDDEMHRSSEIVFSDDKTLLDRFTISDRPTLIDAKYFGNLSQHDLGAILKQLPSNLQTKFSSSIVHERLTDSPVAECVFASKFSARLRNPQFRSGFGRIVKQCHIDEKVTIENLDQRCQEFVNRLDRIEFIGRHRIETYLICEEKSIPHSEKESDFFCENVSTDGLNYWKFHIRSSACIDEMNFRDMLAKIINQATDNLLNKYLLDLSRILERDVNDIQSYLDKLRYCESGTKPLFYISPLGAYIPVTELHLLIQNNFVFYSGELVALELDDPFDRGESGLPTFILVKVLEKLDAEDPSAPVLSSRYRIKTGEIKEMVVSATVLYAFSRANANQEILEQAIVVFNAANEGVDCHSEEPTTPNENSQTPETDGKFGTLQDIIEKIKKMLIEAWKCPEEERKRVRKRLLFTWHPDKNPNHVEICTKVFQILQNLIDMLDQGKNIDDFNISDETSGATSSTFNSRSNSNDYYSDYFDRMRERARHYNYQREQYSENSSRSNTGQYDHSRSNYDDYFTGFNCRPNPQPGEANRWMRQAKHDLQSSVNDRGTSSYPSFDWICLKCYEASKIALRAVQYSQDSNKVTGKVPDNLLSAAVGFKDAQLHRHCAQFEQLITDLSHMKYPSGHVLPMIPCEAYTEHIANEAYRLSNEIINKCSSIISNSI